MGGLEGLAERALRLLDADDDSELPAYVCGESFGGTVAVTLARRDPNRVRGLLLMSTFGYYPSGRIGRAGLRLWNILGDRLTGGLFKLAHPPHGARRRWRCIQGRPRPLPTPKRHGSGCRSAQM